MLHFYWIQRYPGASGMVQTGVLGGGAAVLTVEMQLGCVRCRRLHWKLGVRVSPTFFPLELHSKQPGPHCLSSLYFFKFSPIIIFTLFQKLGFTKPEFKSKLGVFKCFTEYSYCCVVYHVLIKQHSVTSFNFGQLHLFREIP